MWTLWWVCKPACACIARMAHVQVTSIWHGGLHDTQPQPMCTMRPSLHDVLHVAQDRLPSPFGLVRSGVAPDHQDTKVRLRHLNLRLDWTYMRAARVAHDGLWASASCCALPSQLPGMLDQWSTTNTQEPISCAIGRTHRRAPCSQPPPCDMMLMPSSWPQNVINQFTALGKDPRVNFLGNVTLGKDVSLAELRQLYHGVRCFLAT